MKLLSIETLYSCSVRLSPCWRPNVFRHEYYTITNHDIFTGALFMAKHLSDLLAALMQISHAERQQQRRDRSNTSTSTQHCYQHQPDSTPTSQPSTSEQGLQVNKPSVDMPYNGSAGCKSESSNIAGSSYEPSSAEDMSEYISGTHNKLDELVMKTYPPLIVRELLILQSFGGAKVISFIKECVSIQVSLINECEGYVHDQQTNTDIMICNACHSLVLQ